ncbi:hypothetical protein MAPG_11843 [Magnaporthiopsis poae ATCC 64411]|uniref:Uncharacterized protein n=1 Tax=Magnaporthiopsis poae (strain ATCC 64411 / 73-15) TaxID=644358 RepID=A0A0C4EGB2_MAGP6|nr:hypothetical protein MAPG_11843 [Magnaporthiopsis poae ATCC 64411]
MKRPTALVTGVAQELGHALVGAPTDAGYHVFATAQDSSKVDSALQDQQKGRTEVLPLIVMSHESIAGRAAAVKQATGGRGSMCWGSRRGSWVNVPSPAGHVQMALAKQVHNNKLSVNQSATILALKVAQPMRALVMTFTLTTGPPSPYPRTLRYKDVEETIARQARGEMHVTARAPRSWSPTSSLTSGQGPARWSRAASHLFEWILHRDKSVY